MALRHYKLDWIKNSKSSEFFTMAKSVDTTSAQSSISSKATSIKKAVKKSTTVLTRPFKKFKQSISGRSATRLTTSHSSTVILPPDGEADDDNTNSVIDDGSAHGGSEPEAELTPEQELGSSLTSLYCDVILIIYFRAAQTNLALAYLLILQTRCFLSVL